MVHTHSLSQAEARSSLATHKNPTPLSWRRMPPRRNGVSLLCLHTYVSACGLMAVAGEGLLASFVLSEHQYHFTLRDKKGCRPLDGETSRFVRGAPLVDGSSPSLLGTHLDINVAIALSPRSCNCWNRHGVCPQETLQ